MYLQQKRQKLQQIIPEDVSCSPAQFDLTFLIYCISLNETFFNTSFKTLSEVEGGEDDIYPVYLTKKPSNPISLTRQRLTLTV